MPKSALQTADPRADEPIEIPFYIPVTGIPVRPRRTLKHGDIFAAFDSHGDIGASEVGSDGVYFDDTRFLSRLELGLNGLPTLLVGPDIRGDNSQPTGDLHHPRMH